MNLKRIFDEVKIFSETTHGSSQFNKDEFFVKGNGIGDFAPLKYLERKIEVADGLASLLKEGFLCDSYELYEIEEFHGWFEKQFSRKLTKAIAKKIFIIYRPDEKAIFDTISQLNTCYQTFRDQRILLTSKKLPVQLGEWYARCIFGLTQSKSASQRGFDFHLEGQRIEVKIDWGDNSSPKGIKVRKTLLEYSEYLIVIYVDFNFMIREICYLDSQFVLRKFSGKGHTIFLKDSDISSYFFSKSAHYAEKVVDSSALLKYSSPTFAMKISEHFCK